MKQSHSIQFATMKAIQIDVLAFKNCELKSCLSSDLLLQRFPHSDIILKIFRIKINHIEYTRNMVLPFDDEHSVYPIFRQIVEIVKIKDDIFMYVDDLKILNFEEDINAYEIISNNEKNIINILKLPLHKPLSIWKKHGFTSDYVSIKEYL